MKIKKIMLTNLLLLLGTTSFFCQAYGQWARLSGGAGDDRAYSTQQTSDGGYILAGETDSFGAGNYDFLVTKLFADGTVQWSKTFGGTGYDGVFYESYSMAIRQTSDGGYIVAGDTNSFGAGDEDLLIIKLTNSGTIQWAKTFGTATYEWSPFIEQTVDGGYIVSSIGWYSGSRDFLIIKLTSTGTIQWQKFLYGASWDRPHSIRQTSDGGYIVAGETGSFGAGSTDFLIIKLSSSGVIQWQKAYGGGNSDAAWSAEQTSDGGYIVAGDSGSFPPTSNGDFLIIKLTGTGVIQWQKTFDISWYDREPLIHETLGGGYILAGTTMVAGNDDSVIMKLSSSGSVEWAKTFGAVADDRARSVQQTSDGGYVVAGWPDSGNYTNDFLIIKTDLNGDIPDCTNLQDALVTAQDVTGTMTNVTVSEQTSSLAVGNPSVSVSSPTVLETILCQSPCTDNDRDGYGNPSSPDCTYPELDCNDSNALIFPTNPNQFCNCEEPYPQGTEESVAADNCIDGLDNDCDGLIDYDDPDCGAPYGPGPANIGAAYGGKSSLGVSDLTNQLILLLIPGSTVVFLRIVRRKN